MKYSIISLILAVCIFMVYCNSKINSQPTQITKPTTTNTDSSFYKGADISWVTEMEANNYNFYDSSGTKKDAFLLMKELGFNSLRFRVWVHPENQWNSLPDLINKCLRAKALNFNILIDFHYSDYWADPGKQTKPALWQNTHYDALKDSLFNHTTLVLSALKNMGITPRWVQIGNEVDDGMLWPDGKASINMKYFAELINTGYQASKSIFPATEVMVHVSNGFNSQLFDWIFSGLTQNGARFDIIGMSLYPSLNNWQTINSQCLANITQLIKKYNKDIYIVEIGMPYSAPETSFQFISDLITKVKSIPNFRGKGVMYWEPECYNWQNYQLGAFDLSGKPTKALQPFQK
ncbi:MAG: glycosyl hydrolase 53 family protein [Sediminibacterium sp.]|nr:glycosyl hydrolase 53 family protein [Sediminibacterium sp.]